MRRDRLSFLFQLVERCLGLVDAHRQFARPLERGRNIVVVVAEIGAAAGGFELDGERVEPFAGRDRLLLRHFARVAESLVSLSSHITMGVESCAAFFGVNSFRFACGGGGKAGPRLSDAQLILSHPAKSIGFGLSAGLGARLAEIGQAL